MSESEVISSEPSSSESNKKNISWSVENEDILVNWCDTAQCYKWLHNKSHKKYSTKHAWYTIPAIILSTISGTASFAQKELPDTARAFAPIAIGTINIFIGILTTIQQYLKISELNEGHRVASISWDKYQRNIKIELARDPLERTDAKNFIKICRQEYDRLMETSPALDQDIINSFMSTFKGSENSSKRKLFDKLKKPDICDEIITVADTRHKWYEKPLEINASTNEDNQILQTIQDYQIELEEKKRILEEKEKNYDDQIAKQIEDDNNKKILKKNMQEKITIAVEQFKSETVKIEQYIDCFKKEYDRPPTKDEIREYFTEIQNEITSQTLYTFLEKYNDTDHIMNNSNNV